MEQQKWLRISGVVLGITAVTLIIFIASGLFDPHPVGELQWQRPLSTQTIPAQSEQIIWLDETIPPNDFSVQLTAAQQSGELDSGYGLALGNDDHAFIIMVTPTGYVSSQWSALDPRPSPLTPQSWPHVRLDGQANEIWLDAVGGMATIRINRELLWQGDIGELEGQIGLYGVSWGTTAVVDFQQLTLFHE